MIALGDVFLLRCTHCSPPKMKYYVVAQVEPLRMFLINSELTVFQAARPEYVAACPSIAASEHPFLRYDSYLACDHVSHEYSLQDLDTRLNANPAIRLGTLSLAAREALKTALANNWILPTKYVRDIRPLWTWP